MLKKIHFYQLFLIIFIGCTADKTITNTENKQDKNITQYMKKEALSNFFDGQLNEQKGDMNSALIDYLEAYRIDPQNKTLNFAIGKAYYSLKKYESAKKYLETAALNSEATHEIDELLFPTYLILGDTVKAEKIFTKKIGFSNNKLVDYISMGLAFEKTNPAKALNFYLKAYEFNPEQNEIFIKIIQSYINTKNEIQLLSFLSKCKLPEGVTQFHIMLDYYIGTKNPSRTLSTFLNEKNPKDIKTYVRVIQYFTSISDTEKVKTVSQNAVSDTNLQLDFRTDIFYLYAKLIVNNPTRCNQLHNFISSHNGLKLGESNYFLGNLLELQKDTANAIKEYKTALDKCKNQYFALNLASLYTTKKDFHLSNSLLKEYADTTTSFRINYLLGFNYSQLEDFPNSEKYLKKAVEIDGDISLYNMLSYVLYKNNKVQEAISYVLTALKENKDNFALLTSLGMYYNSMNNFEKTDSAYSKAMQINPNDPTLLNNYAYALSEKGIRLDDALEMVTKAISVEPENASFLDTKGWIFFQLNQDDNAILYIEKSLKLDEKNATVWEHLGDIYYKKGDLKTALRHWKKALSLDEKNKQILDKIKRKK